MRGDLRREEEENRDETVFKNERAREREKEEVVELKCEPSRFTLLPTLGNTLTEPLWWAHCFFSTDTSTNAAR